MFVQRNEQHSATTDTLWGAVVSAVPAQYADFAKLPVDEVREFLSESVFDAV